MREGSFSYPCRRTGNIIIMYILMFICADIRLPDWQLTSSIWYTFVCFWRSSPTRARASSFTMFLDHTQRLITVGRTPLDEWSAHRRDLYLTTHNTHNSHPFIPPPPGGIRTHDLSRWAAADLRPRPCGHWVRQMINVLKCNWTCALPRDW